MKKAGILFALIILLMVNLILAGELRVTQEHPFFVNGEWVTASDLQVGDELITSSGEKVKIISIKDVSSPTEVYNLDSSETDDFVVGVDNIVVHNSDMPLGLTDAERAMIEAGVEPAEVREARKAKNIEEYQRAKEENPDLKAYTIRPEPVYNPPMEGVPRGDVLNQPTILDNVFNPQTGKILDSCTGKPANGEYYVLILENGDAYISKSYDAVASKYPITSRYNSKKNKIITEYGKADSFMKVNLYNGEPVSHEVQALRRGRFALQGEGELTPIYDYPCNQPAERPGIAKQLLELRIETMKTEYVKPSDVSLYINPKDVVVTGALRFPEQYLDSARKKEIKKMVENEEPAYELNDIERMYYAKILLDKNTGFWDTIFGVKDFSDEEIRRILAAHRSEGLRNKADILKRGSGDRENFEEVFTPDERRYLIEGGVTGSGENLDVFDSRTGGEKGDIKDRYSLVDPENNLGTIRGISTLRQTENFVNNEDPELVEVYRLELGKIMQNKYSSATEAKRAIWKEFLDVFGLEVPKDKERVLSTSARQEINNVFRERTGGGGGDFNTRQKKILNRYGLESRREGRGIKVYIQGTDIMVQATGVTPSSQSSGIKFAGELIDAIEANLKEGNLLNDEAIQKLIKEGAIIETEP